MKSFRKWLGIIEPEPIRILNISWLHRDLTEKQISYLEHLISNYRNHDMAICRCDIERVLGMHDCSEVKMK